MKLSVIKTMTGLLCSMMLITSCSQFSDIEEIDGVEINAEYAVPLINSSATLIEMLNAAEADLSSINIEDDGNFVFSYEKEGPEKGTAELFGTLPNFPFVLIDTFVSVQANLFPNVSLDKIHLKSGSIRFEMVSPYPEDINISITFPNLKKDGVPFQVTQRITYDGSSPSTGQIAPVSLAGYDFEFPNGMMEMRYEAFNGNNQRVALSIVAGEAENWEYEYMQGVWANDVFQLEKDTLEIDAFDTAIDGDFSITDPSMTIQLENSFGFPVMALINSLKMINAAGEVVELQSSLFSEGIYLNYPKLNEVNVSKTTKVTFNKSNSNIADLVNSQPQFIIYDLGIMINPDEDPNSTGFITDQGKIKASIKTAIPAEGTFRFSREELVDIDFNDTDDIESGSFKLITENGMPISTDLQFYFIDADQNKIDSLFSKDLHILDAAVVDANSVVTQSSLSQVEETIDAARMNRIKNSTQMLVKTAVATSNDGTIPVRILSTQRLDVKLGMTIKVKN